MKSTSRLTPLRSGSLKTTLDSARNRFPGAYWKVRKAVALCEWFWDRRTHDSGQRQEPYDAVFWNIHQDGDWSGFARLVMEHFAPTSLIDVGCGDGAALQGFQVSYPLVRLKGIDSSQEALRRAAAKGLDACHLDFVDSSTRDVQRSAEALGRFDVVLCLEVAEHLPAWHAHKLIRFLTTWDTVIFSAAQPNQGGVLHVNEQPAAYWITRFEQVGFRLSPRNDQFCGAVGRLIGLPAWYRANVRVFGRVPAPPAIAQHHSD